MAEEITALWQEAEQHLRAFEQLARRTVKEAWLAGDALMRIKEQVPHGGWRAGLEERGISKSTAHRFITLRKRYPEMSQVGTFRSVQAALTDSKKSSEVESAAPTKRQYNPAHPVSAALNGGRTVRPRRVVSPYLVTLDDLWDWERWGPSAIARRFMEADEIDAFGSAIEGAVRRYIEESETRAELFQALAWFRLALSCQVDFGPYENDPGARAETGRRDVAYRDGDFYWVGDMEDFLRLTDTHVARLPQSP